MANGLKAIKKFSLEWKEALGKKGEDKEWERLFSKQMGLGQSKLLLGNYNESDLGPCNNLKRQCTFG